MAIKEPNIKDKTMTGELGQDLIEFLVELRAQVDRDDEDRANWKLKLAAAANQRLGIKRASNWPYSNAPEIPLPETDKLIKKSLPNLVLSSWQPKKMCRVQVEQGTQETPELKLKAKKSEAAMNMILRSKMDLFNKKHLAANFLKEKGHFIVRIVEEFKTRKVHKVIDLNDYDDGVRDQLKAASNDILKQFLANRYGFDLEDDDDKKEIQSAIEQFRSGDDVIEFDVTDISSMPNVEIPLPTRVIAPAYTTDINKSPRVAYEYYKTRYEVETLMEQGVWLKKDLDDISFTSRDTYTTDMVEYSKRYASGLQDNTGSKDLYRIREICCWWKEKESEPAEKWVFTFIADVGDPETALLQRIKFPFEFEGWNYEKCDNEAKDPNYYNSRGTPEQIRAIQEMMERSINNMLIRDEMNNNPTYEVLNTSDILDMHTHFVPGELIPVQQIGTEIRRINDPIKVDLSSERILQLLKAYAEEYVGSVDQLFRNATNRGGGKTLGEVQEGIRQTAGPINMEVINWNECWSRVYRKIFDIMKERLGDSIWVEGQEVTREDFNFPASVRSNGNLEVSDQDLATQKAIMRLQMIAMPVFADCVNAEDKYNALKDWLEKDGVKDPDEFCTDPKVIAQTQIAQMQRAIQQMAMQMQGMQKQAESQQKELAKNQKKGREIVKRTQGELEAVVENAGLGAGANK